MMRGNRFYKYPSTALLRLGLAGLMGLAGLTAFTGRVQAQTLSYSGKVVDQGGTALPWAIIRSEGSATVTQSGADGTFAFSGPAALAPFPGGSAPGTSGQAAPSGFSLSPSPSADADLSLPDGRHAAVTHLAEVPFFQRADIASGSRRPIAAKSAATSGTAAASAAYSLNVAKVNYQDANFPQASATGAGLVLTLLKSATDTATYAAEKKMCLDTVNACRATLGLKPVAWSKSLEAFADEGARYDAGLNTAHSHFSKFSPRAVPADAENAIPDWPLKSYKSVGNIVKEGTKMMWAEGPGGGHYENIKGDQTQVGCGIFVTAAGGVWIVQDFK
jgi:uncharacterized protein YkwD